MQGRWHLLACCILSIFLVGAEVRAQTPADQFELARHAFQYQDYEKVIKLLEPLLEPEPALPSADMVLLAREWLGASLWWKGDRTGFRQQYTRLLQSDATFELDAFYYPPEMIKEFEDLRKQLIELKVIKVGEPKPRENKVILQRTVERHSGWTTLLPLGGGQFANDRPGKGAFFLAAQALCLGGNGGAWLYMYYENPRGDARTAALWTMYGSLVALGGFYLWGVLDALADFEPVRVREEQREEAAWEKRVAIPGGSASIFSIVPVTSPSGGAGLGVELRF